MKRQALRRPPARPHSIEALEQRIAPATFTVTTVNDIGAGSLREAITNANNTAGPDVIDFNILGATGGLKTIALRSALPRIFDSVLIDGYTQPGASPNTLGPGFGTNATPLIEVTGALIGVPGIVDGLSFGGSGSTVRGLVLNGFSGHGIATTGVSGMTFAGNFIGTNATGTALVPNAGSGIFIDGFSNTVGGSNPADRNLISGNAAGGVLLEGQVTDGNTVAGNLIGTNAAGNAILGSGAVGVSVSNIASGNVIGGLLPGARNVFVGATFAGVRLDGVSNTILHGNYIGTDVTGTTDLGNETETGVRVTNAPGTRIGGNVAGAGNLVSGNMGGITIEGNSTGTIIQGNLIGTNAAGAAALPNTFWGIGVFSSNVTIGGEGAAGRNVISGNAEAGVLLSGFGPSGVRVEGNYIGVAADGATPLGNRGHGVFIFVGTNNSVGGVAANAGNIIAHNGFSGVVIESDAGLGNTIQGNQIFSNGTLGIDLNNNGPTANDVADVDGGPNGLQNYPIITSASVGGGGTTISGTLQSTPSTLFSVQLFANSAADPSGFGEGEIFLGTTSVNTDPNGTGTFTFSAPTPLPNSFISATATANGSTSEFSQVRQAIAVNTVFTWDGSAGTDWFTAANWTPDGVPGPGDTAVLDTISTINLPRDTSVDVFRHRNGTFTSPAGVTFTIMESFEWSGGRQAGAGTTLLAVGSNSPFSGAASKNLEGRLLDNAGTVTWTGTGAIGMPGGTITNRAGAIFDAQTDADILIPQGLGLPGGVFNNAGTFRKSASSGVTELPPVASVAITFNNTGTLDAQTGVVSFNGGLTNSGTFNAAAGASIEVRTAFTVADGAQFTGAGATRLLSGVTTANGTIGGGSLVLEGATLDGSHTLAGGLRWVSGTIGALFVAGTTTIPAGATLTLDNPLAVGLDGRSLVNAGTIVLQQAGGINMPGSTITNQQGATFNVQTDADLAVPQGLGLPAGTFDNAGIFRKSGGTGATEVPPTASVAITFNNTGVVDAQTGTVAFNATATSSGIFATGAGANIDVRGTFAVSDGAQFNGGGATRLLAGRTTANGIIGSAALVLDGATLEGTHTLAGGLVWISGNIGRQFAGGATTIPNSATLTLNNPATVGLEGHSLINAGGAVRLINSGALSMPGSTITNQPGALFEFQTDADIIIPSGLGLPAGTFNNLGSLRKSGGSGVSEFSVGGVALDVTNGGAVGAVEALSGTIHFGHGFTQSAGSTTLAGGNLATSSTLTFAGGELRGTGLITGAVNNSGGIVRPGSTGPGVLSINGNYTQGSAGILGIEIGGAAAGSQHDQLNVTGTASLAGELNVQLINGFTPSLGASFVVLPYASRTGSFSALTGNAGGLTENYQATALTLEVQAPPLNLIVTTALDVFEPEDSVLSLREAILFANQNIGFDTITFNIPGTGVQTISPATPLPAVTERLAINGYSQPGAAANSLPNGNNAVLLIQLSGTPGVAGNGLALNAGNSRVEGLIINGFDDGIVINGPGGDVIAGNWIGVNATGSGAAANRDDGIEVNASNVLIGGTTAAARNVISGNTQRGIELTGGFGSLTVQGNFIGTNAAGMSAVSNGEGGVRAGTFNINSPNVLIGGSLPGARNVISGNGEAGVHLQDSSSAIIFGNYIGVAVDGVTPIGNTAGVILNTMTGSSVGGPGVTEGNVLSGNTLGVFVLGGSSNSIQGNLIGVDTTGAIAVGNNIGVQLISTDETLIGGFGSGLRNVISGNATNGILLGQGSFDAIIDGNFIGTNAAGAALGNGGHGIAFADSNVHTVLRNTIAHNGGAGVAILTGRGISVIENSIHDNLGLGIDLGTDGATPNDTADADVGANDLLNFPVITSVTPEAGGSSLITGTISAVPNTILRIDLFGADNSTLEGETFLGFIPVTTDSAGSASFQLSILQEALSSASHLVATATDLGGAGTSEFGTPFQIGLPPGPTISVADVAITEGQSGTKIATFTVTLSEAAAQAVSVNFATEDLTALAGNDYQAAAGVLTFAPGDLTETISVTINGDTTGEARERFLLNLTEAVNATLSDPEATGVIRDDDHHLLVTGDAKGTLVRVFDATTGELTAQFDAFDADFRGGVRVATGDVNGDGVHDIIAGAGVAGDARVRVFDGVTHDPLPGLLGDFSAFGRFYRGGVFVAAGDVDGDGFADVIVSPSGGGSGEVRVFDGTDGTELVRVRAFGKGSGGVRVAAGDVNGDGRADIIAGSGLGSTVRIFDASTGGLLGGNDSEFRAFGKNFRGGIYVAAGDVNGDGRDDVIASTATDGKTFRIFEAGSSRSDFDEADAYPGALRGVRVGAVDANSDGIADIITAKARGDAKVTLFDGNTHDRLFRLSGYPTNFLGGVFVG